MSARRRVRSRVQGVFQPPLEAWPDAGVYQLHVRVSRTVQVNIGRLGCFRFPAGFYVYTGRASRGLRARVWRHVCGAPRKHWHIDYLLAQPGCRVKRVVPAAADPDTECTVNQSVSPGASCPAPGFGASDCGRQCAAHLWHLQG